MGMAYDGIEAEEAIKKRRPDLIILDIMMPRKDGYVLCAELKAGAQTRENPTFSSRRWARRCRQRYSHADGMATEADDYIPKPIDTGSLGPQRPICSAPGNQQGARQFMTDQAALGGSRS